MVRHRGSTPPLWGFIPSAAASWITWALVAAGLVCAFLAVVSRVQHVGADQSVTRLEDDTGAESGQERSEKKELRANMLYGLQEIVREVDDIWAENDEFEMEANAYHQQFNDLLVSSTGTRLGEEDPWAVGYFYEKWNRRLPKPSAAADYRANLSTLMEPIRDALRKQHLAYRPSLESLDNIQLIATRVKLAKESYYYHRVLLDALVAQIKKGCVDKKTLKQRVEELEHKMVLAKFGHPSASNEQQAASTPRLAPESAETDATGSTDVGGLDELYEQARREADGGSQFGRTTLIRDAVKDTRGVQR
jgi:hypothetical protein